MNQDQIKEKLLQLEQPISDFSVVLSGKSSAKVNGLYKIQSREIVLHNRNFHSDEELIYTAIHEYAHHLICERSPGIPNTRAHTVQFWTKFHELLDTAERLGVYKNLFETNPEFISLIQKIRSLMPHNGELFLEMGKLIREGQDLCTKHHVRFEDFIDRALGIPRKTAFAAAQAFSYQLAPDYGWDNLSMLGSIASPEKRTACIQAIEEGKSHEQLRNIMRTKRQSQDPKTMLIQEKKRIERTINYLKNKLEIVEQKLSEIESETGTDYDESYNS